MYFMEDKMEQVKVKFMKMDTRAQMPVYGTEYSAGADLFACMEQPVTIHAGKTEFIHTGIAVAIPRGLVGLIYARSGLACRQGLAPANKVGVIDSDYRGEIIVALHNHSAEDLVVEPGQRVAQMVIAPYIYAEYEENDGLDETDRGDGGFGSTGNR
jgi:dUTP pyrophosphatase